MLIDARQLADGGKLESDVCIVGAGAAGITIARELIPTPLTVCLLESGGLEPDARTQALCRGENAGLPCRPLDENRQRAFGGTTGLWAGWCRPLDDVDFAERPWVPHSGWPFSKAELLPFYRRAHAVCELGPFEYDPEYWEKRLRLSRLPLGDAEFATRIYQLGPPTRFGPTYLGELARAANVRAVLHANLLEIETTESGAAVTGLRVATLEGKRFAVRARQYVLATGGIENARLLLLSNKRQGAGLGNDNDLVGRYFMEHLHFPAGAIRFARAHAESLELYVRNGQRAVARLFPTPATQEQEGLLNCSLSLKPEDSLDRLGLAAAFRDTARAAHRLRRWLGRSGTPARLPWRTKRMQLHHTLEQAPNPDSRVTLSSERDALGLLRVRLDWRMTALDLRTAERTLQLLGSALQRADLGRLEVEARGEAWPPPPLQGSRGHHMGTTRMSANPRHGVVDPQCRVHGMANLFVAGSSVFPTAGAGTPTLTIVALALRLADHLKSLASSHD